MAKFFIKKIEDGDDDLMRSLSSVQKALIMTLNSELTMREEEPIVWAAFNPIQGDVNQLEVVFCPLGTANIVGSLKIDREGEITEVQGLGNEFLQ